MNYKSGFSTGFLVTIIAVAIVGFGIYMYFGYLERSLGNVPTVPTPTVKAQSVHQSVAPSPSPNPSASSAVGTPPPEYQLLKGSDNWSLTFDAPNTLSCPDGQKGNTANPHVFRMISAGITTAKTDALYMRIVQTLEQNGWEKCGSTALSDAQATFRDFIKGGRILYVIRAYSSEGYGQQNGVSVTVQYLKQ